MSNISKCRRIAAHLTYYRHSLQKGLIVSVDDRGVVVGINHSENIDSEAGVEFYNGILIPEFVNAHCHLELSYLQNNISSGDGFTAFARQMGRLRCSATAQERFEALSCQDAKMWHMGVGAVGDISNGTTSFDAKSSSKIRYLNFIELFGLGLKSTDVLVDVVAYGKRVGLSTTITPHSTYSLNNDAFCAAVRGADSTLPLSIHFMESEAERELYSGKGELADWYLERKISIDFAKYISPARRIVACVPPERDVMLIHNCFVTEEDIDIIESHFTGRVTWVLSPRSNLYISGVMPPVELLRRKGVNIAIGTDSLASNSSLDMIAELRAFDNVPLEELLWWATGAGAEALCLKGAVGEFEIGYRSGLVLIESLDWDSLSLREDSTSRRIV